MPKEHKNAVNYPYLRCDGETYNIAEMDKPALLQLKTRLETDMDNIRYQMDMADSGNRVTERSDPRWWAGVKYVLSTKSRQVQAIQTEINRRKKEGLPPIGPFFISIAREKLPRPVFDVLLELAHQERIKTTLSSSTHNNSLSDQEPTP